MKRRIVGFMVLMLVGVPVAVAGSWWSGDTGNVPWGTPGPIGSTTPSTGVFTQVFGDNGAGGGLTDKTIPVSASSVRSALVTTRYSAASGVTANSISLAYESAAGLAPIAYFLRAHGAPGSPTIVSTGDTLGQLVFGGYDGATYRANASISVVAKGTPASGVMPAELDFRTSNLSGNSTIALTLDASGAVVVASTLSNTTCTLNGASPSLCTTTTLVGLNCSCTPVGATAAIAAGGCAVDAAPTTSTTATFTGPNGATNKVVVHCE